MTYIKEVILENFMSYKYSRIKFTRGLNIITGPNGSGKSSILLGISVALGQTYTERGRRLGDLVRKGEDIARVTVVFDNSRHNNRKPFPWFRSNEVYFTRYIRRDGEYWHEVNGRVTPKVEVIRYLSRVGINPNNMLIIMHQNMIEQFVYLSPQEKLKMVEDVLGLRIYRERIISSLAKLSEVEREEEKVRVSLKQAEEQYSHWSELYKRYLRKRELEEKLSRLLAEKHWILVSEKEKELKDVSERIRSLSEEISRMMEDVHQRENDEQIILQEISGLEEKILEGDIEKLPIFLRGLREKWISYAEKHADIREIRVRLSFLKEELKRIKKERQRILRRIKELMEKAESYGERVYSSRSVEEVEEEIRRVELDIASIGEIPQNTLEIYNRYKEIFEEYNAKVRELTENKERLKTEIEKRIKLWEEKILDIVEKLQHNFSRYLEKIGATGRINIVNLEDVNNAGLEIMVGFRGSPMSILDPYTHSGGERTSTVMCFFLSLQDYVKSPLRAIDEFDVHMDPQNRKILLSTLFEISRNNPEIQYIIITPGVLDEIPPNSNILIVQKTRSISELYKLGSA